MNKPNRLATSNKVEIIDRTSQHFGKTGKVIDTRLVPIEILNKPTSSKVECYVIVELDDTETTETFTLSQLKKYNDC